MLDHERYWSRLLRDWQRSGLSRAAFCRRQGISYHALSYWKRRLQVETGHGPDGDGGQNNGHRGFVEVAVQARRVGAGAAGYEIVLSGGRIIRLPLDFEADAVARLNAAVEGTPPRHAGAVAGSC